MLCFSFFISHLFKLNIFEYEVNCIRINMRRKLFRFHMVTNELNFLYLILEEDLKKYY